MKDFTFTNSQFDTTNYATIEEMLDAMSSDATRVRVIRTGRTVDHDDDANGFNQSRREGRHARNVRR